MDTATAVATVKDAEHVGTWLWRLVWHPRLELLFDPSKTFTTSGHTYHPGRTARYLHAICRNVSWFVTAHGCKPYLRTIFRESPTGPNPLPGFVGPVPLRWANTPEEGPFAYQPAEIRRRQGYRIDVGYQLQGESFFRLYIPLEYVGVERELPPGTYLLDIEVTCTNALRKQTNRRFQLVVGPTWGSAILSAI